jgi:hypothetical protein
LNSLLACGMACTHVAISGIGTWSRCMSGGEKTSCSTAPRGKRSGTGASDVASCSMSRISLAAERGRKGTRAHGQLRGRGPLSNICSLHEGRKSAGAWRNACVERSGVTGATGTATSGVARLSLCWVSSGVALPRPLRLASGCAGTTTGFLADGGGASGEIVTEMCPESTSPTVSVANPMLTTAVDLRIAFSAAAPGMGPRQRQTHLWRHKGL